MTSKEKVLEKFPGLKTKRRKVFQRFRYSQESIGLMRPLGIKLTKLPRYKKRKEVLCSFVNPQTRQQQETEMLGEILLWQGVIFGGMNSRLLNKLDLVDDLRGFYNYQR